MRDEARNIQTPNLLIWSQTRYRCAIAPVVVQNEPCKMQSWCGTFSRASATTTRSLWRSHVRKVYVNLLRLRQLPKKAM